MQGLDFCCCYCLFLCVCILGEGGGGLGLGGGVGVGVWGGGGGGVAVAGVCSLVGQTRRALLASFFFPLVYLLVRFLLFFVVWFVCLVWGVFCLCGFFGGGGWRGGGEGRGGGAGMGRQGGEAGTYIHQTVAESIDTSYPDRSSPPPPTHIMDHLTEL